MRLVWNPEKCDACGECAKACPKGVLKLRAGVPEVCRQCDPKYAVCAQACKNGAIVANREGTLVVVRSRCDGCGRCAEECAACEVKGGKAEKCDLCAASGGKPRCVNSCSRGALELSDDGQEESHLVEIPAVEFGADSEPPRDAPLARTAPAKRKIAKEGGMNFVGDGKRIPVIKYGGGVNFGGKERRLASGISFRSLGLPPQRKVQLLEGNNGARVYSVEGLGNVFYLDFPNFSEENWKVAEQAKYFTIRQVADELLEGNGSEGSRFSHEERKARLARVAAIAERILAGLDPMMDSQRRGALARIIAADSVGFGPVEFLWKDGGQLEEVEINHPEREIVVYHRKHGRCLTNLALSGERGFRRVMNSILMGAGGMLDDAHPAVDAQLPDGSRLHAQIYPLALSGASANIRFFSGEAWTIPRMMQEGTLSAEMGAFLWLAVESRRVSMVITGPPAAGKTSFLSALLAFIPQGERIISIEEEMNELRFYDAFIDWVPLRGFYDERKEEALRKSRGVGVARTMMDQVANALRMRPDRIILGELRGAEAQKLFSGANLGVPFMTTMHSNERGSAVVKRLHSPPMSVPCDSLSHLDLVVSMAMNSEKRRKVIEISELSWKSRGWAARKGGLLWEGDGDAAHVAAAYAFDEKKKGHASLLNGSSRVLEVFGERFGRSEKDVREEIEKRASVLERLAAEGKTSFAEVGKAVSEYSQKGAG